jgi:hypothetical protein
MRQAQRGRKSLRRRWIGSWPCSFKARANQRRAEEFFSIVAGNIGAGPSSKTAK